MNANLFAQQTASQPWPAGVPREMALERKSILRNIHYLLSFQIPERKSMPIAGKETIEFDLLNTSREVSLDFKEAKDHLHQIIINGQQEPVALVNEHIILPSKKLKKGNNKISILFTAGDLSLNRNDDYLYTLLVPDRARTLFPCFDQPDLKAIFTLHLQLPNSWKAIANAPVRDSSAAGSYKIYRYQPSQKISTYLFSFVAGNFNEFQRPLSSGHARFLYRETDTSKIRLSMAPVYSIHEQALGFLKNYTGISFPFTKLDFAAIPDFQYGGMEHVGAIQYKASSLFLDKGATKDQELSRSNLIAHETSHMWFGDLVTMKWFNDVWMKEVFANFMADKITKKFFPENDFGLHFLTDHMPAAYSIDRTQGANPIRQPLDNLADAGSLYGNIIYHKAPEMMRQLELLMGAEKFRQGLAEYLQTFRFGNASWPDLIHIMERHTKEDLQQWNKVWVNEPGRPVFSFLIKNENEKIQKLVLKQQAEDGSEKIWPQYFDIALVYPDHITPIKVQTKAANLEILKAENKTLPVSILWNASGLGYGRFPFDEEKSDLPALLPQPVMRASWFINLYEHFLAEPEFNKNKKVLSSFYLPWLERETDEQVLRLMTGQFAEIYWKFTDSIHRASLAPLVEQAIWKNMEKQTDANKKKVFFRLYQNIAITSNAQENLYRIWQDQKAPAGLVLTEDDYTSLALALAVRDNSDQQIISVQLSRVKNIDRKQRLEFIRPALSHDEAERDRFFESLSQEKNREKEAWVVLALQYLHHPLRTATSEKYLAKTLELLQEIQLTGDIFFPQSWLQASFANYHSDEAVQTVKTFLNSHKNYNPGLKNKILQSANDLFLANRMLLHQKV